MKKVLIFLPLAFALCAFSADEQKYRFVVGGSIGSQTTWFKNADTNVKWSNMGETLYNKKGGL
ncbi:hypothetical protein, partial [Helicobacter japonicus]